VARLVFNVPMQQAMGSITGLTLMFILALLALGAVTVQAGAPQRAEASFLLAQNGRPVLLQADRSGVAWVRYVRGGRTVSATLSGAVNATPRFRVRYTQPQITNACGPYRGPRLPYQVLACSMPDGSHWMVQVWQRLKPNFGGTTGVPEIHVSHWSGELPVLDVHSDWAWQGQFEHVYGTVSYKGDPVYGGSTDRFGNPLDRLGRNIYLDALAPADYRPRRTGWVRVNGILAQRPKGAFCYAFSPKSTANLPAAMQANPNVQATGRSSKGRYRAAVSGPGVTPVVVTAFSSPPPYDPDTEAAIDAEQRSLFAPTSECRRELGG
jgi:hypothetical protein